tara:strand:- start:825 stop:2525 length:1701 start_codon:yes stop_codon:yes gene_type:complete
MSFKHNNAVGFYNFEDSTDLGADVSGYDRDGTLNNVTTRTEGSEQFADFNGTDSYVDLSSHVAQASGLSAFSGAFRVVLDKVAGAQAVFSLTDSSDGSSNFSLFFSGTSLFLQVRENGAAAISFAASTTFAVDTEYHIAFSTGSAGAFIWVDGVQRGTDAATESTNAVLTPDKMYLGLNQDSSGFEWEFDGGIKDAYIANVEIDINTVNNMIDNDAYGFEEIALLGQSNIIGRADIRTGIDDDYTAVSGNVYQWGYNAQTLTAATNPLDHNQSEGGGNADNMGSWLAMCNSLVSKLPYKKKILLIPAATGSTGFVGTAGWVSPAGTQYAGAVSTMVAARGQSTLSRLSLVCWWQGEYDAGNGGAAAYNTNLSAMVTAFQAEATLDWTTSTPFCCLAIGEVVNTADSVIINGHLKDFADASAVRSYIDTTSLELAVDDVHFTAASYVSAGSSIASEAYRPQLLTKYPNIIDSVGDSAINDLSSDWGQAESFAITSLPTGAAQTGSTAATTGTVTEDETSLVKVTATGPTDQTKAEYFLWQVGVGGNLVTGGTGRKLRGRGFYPYRPR